MRELHWYKEEEWAYMLLGRARITAVDQNGRNFITDVGPQLMDSLRKQKWPVVKYPGFSYIQKNDGENE